MEYKDKILARVDKKKGPQKGPITLYLTKQLYAEFKKLCGDRHPSLVIEEMIRLFVENSTPSKKK